jgi:hypothetical protein
MKRTIAMLAILLLLLPACRSLRKTGPTEQRTQEHQAYAYVRLIAYMHDNYHPSGKYLAVDYTGCLLEDTDTLTTLLRDYCDANGLELLLGTMDDMIAGGYVETQENGMANLFPNGALYSFRDKKLTPTKLVTNASVWYGSLGANGAEFTVTLKKGAWHVEDPQQIWIS